MHCPCTGTNISRFVLALAAGFAFKFGFDFIVHQKILMDLYTQTQDLWRPHDDMSKCLPIMLGFNLLLVGIVGYIFTRNFEGKGIMEGVRFGVPMGLLLALMMSSSYIWMPIPIELAMGWAASGLGLGLGLGIIFALLYKK
jgi:hypothetical protein